MNMRSQLIHLADTYCAIAEISRSRLSTLVLNDGKGLERIASGRDITTRKYESVLQWLSNHWPDGADWPTYIERPTPAIASEAIE